MRYQQIYSGSDFSGDGIIDDIRYRLDGTFGAPFTTSELISRSTWATQPQR